MKNIVQVAEATDLDSYQLIVGGTRKPQKPVLVSKLADVKLALEEYQYRLKTGTVSPLGFINETFSYHYHLYDSTQTNVVALKSQLVATFDQHTCPYCQLDQVSHIDHFLPRSEFPEFSIALQNLVMACDACNSKYKGEHWGVGRNQKIFHPQYNDLRGMQYLEATAVYEKNAIRVTFNVVSGLPMSGLIKRHFAKLNLAKRYIAKANSSEVPKLRRLLKLEPSIARKRSRIQQFVNDQIACNPVNSWEHAYYLALRPILPAIVTGGF